MQHKTQTEEEDSLEYFRLSPRKQQKVRKQAGVLMGKSITENKI
tara:strand:+ start:1994 stop:2125 length:132 start_codon:yes stop_codon:yes gene_type:complete